MLKNTQKLFNLFIPKLLQNNKYYCHNPKLMVNHLAELTVKATRRQFLARTVLNQDKQVINAELRKP